MSFVTRFIAGLGLLAATGTALAQPLTLETYNPRDAAVFPVTSTLISGEKDAILIDAQFSNREAQELVERIQASGKRLTTIFISHGDPDYYFGLDVLTRAFPDAKVLATPATIAHIEATRAPKLAYWGPILKDSAPARTLVPEALQGNLLELEGQRIEVVGGILTSANIHVWVADSQTAEARKSWLKSLDELEALQPTTLVPGHYLGEPAMNLTDLHFTRDYLLALEEELPKAKDSQALLAAMKARYPDLQDESSLELSAKVLKGEMQWP
ncbi:MBL fold metallo-hydrolase [Pseudomonas sp. UBA6323]|uniref:MBL fold metallo-hydrolase n=1 Tax=Pseudomonas sp. UBA6323 TaxID=1947329 RepID=UPI0025FA19BD|nr:MBL fold metallo-hydrolase [Pseudomonas sp. UBA6323]